ncbi:zeta toxin family protein [Methylomonas sp. EFPC1]|uniref:zeta toxin family protein n=1 Tax=Methylomonas sp. EFPC1 TaxID=2812647 RepID=UPI001968432C|nr:zeta toxin family protein [Methylomonas sp. EFPC1]QSB02022.1 zeta toxin family protein [Methylomonas sp. EFPC1]
MTTPTQPVCRIIAGPNGAGKTTFALKYLPLAQCRHFVNADLIAAGLSPLAPEEQTIAASRLFLREIEQHVVARRDFAFETTLSGRTYLRLIQRLRRQGWRVELVYLALPAVEISQLRVAERVKHGGHSIAVADIVRRFPRSLRNLFGVYADAVDYVCCFLNTGESPELVFTRDDGTETIFQNAIYQQLLHEAQ